MLWGFTSTVTVAATPLSHILGMKETDNKASEGHVNLLEHQEIVSGDFKTEILKVGSGTGGTAKTIKGFETFSAIPKFWFDIG